MVEKSGRISTQNISICTYPSGQRATEVITLRSGNVVCLMAASGQTNRAVSPRDAQIRPTTPIPAKPVTGPG